MTSAIYYSKDAFRINKNKALGRQVAGNDFLEAYCKYTNYSNFWVYARTRDEANDFAKFSIDNGIKRNIRFINFENTLALKEPGLLFFPGPDVAELSRNRSFFASNAWSICGVTHTTSSKRIMKSIESIVTSPLESWDALICTSKSVKSNITTIIETTENNLRIKLGAKTFVRPQLPVIPLGIDTSKFNYQEKDKINSRAKFGIQSDEIVVLYLGRLSFHAKANPYPMYKALEKTHRDTQKKIVLIECGWYANNEIKEAFIQAAECFCPSIRLLRVDGNDNEVKNCSLAAADIFCSLSDNIQETFGITPIEAMASGLPCVVSDWNGYKDTIRHEIDGFRIQSLMPNEGLGNDLALRYSLGIDSYDMYIGHASNLISIDIDQTTLAFTKLISDKNLRNKMGENARKRCQNEYDWKTIMNKYTDLWKNLHEIRNDSSNKLSNYKSADSIDPFLSFSSYPSKILSEDKIISIKKNNYIDFSEKIKKLKKLYMINYASYVIPDENFLKKLLTDIHHNKKSLHELKKCYQDINYAYFIRAILWLHKFDFIIISD